MRGSNSARSHSWYRVRGGITHKNPLLFTHPFGVCETSLKGQTLESLESRETAMKKIDKALLSGLIEGHK